MSALESYIFNITMKLDMVLVANSTKILRLEFIGYHKWKETNIMSMKDKIYLYGKD